MLSIGHPLVTVSWTVKNRGETGEKSTIGEVDFCVCVFWFWFGVGRLVDLFVSLASSVLLALWGFLVLPDPDLKMCTCSVQSQQNNLTSNPLKGFDYTFLAGFYMVFIYVLWFLHGFCYKSSLDSSYKCFPDPYSHIIPLFPPATEDSKYAEERLTSDRAWCPRNFLHTYRLAFPWRREMKPVFLISIYMCFLDVFHVMFYVSYNIRVFFC